MIFIGRIKTKIRITTFNSQHLGYCKNQVCLKCDQLDAGLFPRFTTLLCENVQIIFSHLPSVPASLKLEGRPKGFHYIECVVNIVESK